MTDYKKINNLIHLVDRAMSTCHYVRAEKLFRQLLQEAIKSKDYDMAHRTAEALVQCHRLHARDALSILKRIDPIQAQRKVLS